MADTIYPNLGTLKIQVQFGGQPSNDPDPKSDLLAGCEVLSADIEEGLDVWATWSILVSATDQKYFDKIIQNVTLKNTPCWVRMGLSNVTTRFFRPWEPMILTNVKAVSPSSASQKTVLIELADVLYGFYNQNTKVWKGTVSDSLKKVLAGDGQTPTPYQVVTESTQGQFTIYQSFQSDWDFIRRRLQIRASNTKGSGGFHLWARDAKVIFGTADFKEYGAKAYNIQATPPASYTQIAFEDSSKLLAPRGGAGYNEIPFSPLTRAQGVLGSDPSKILSMGDSSPAFPKADINYSPKHTGDNDPSEIQYQAQAKFAFQKEQFYTVSMVMAQQPVIRIGDYITIPATTDFGLFKGNYWVRGLSHKVRRGSMTTVVTASRGQLVPDGQSTGVQTPGGQPVSGAQPGASGIPFSLPQDQPSPGSSTPGTAVPVSNPEGFNIQTGQTPTTSDGFGLGTGVTVPSPFGGGP